MFKSIIKRLLPDPVLRYFTGFFYGWSGDFSTWDEAKLLCTGYDSPEIFKKVRESSLKVRNGEAEYERDSVIYDHIIYSYPLLACLMWISALNAGKLNVLDYGGSLGSSYYQNLRFLNSLKDFNWSIVEQAGFVDIGLKDLQDNNLHFYYSLKDCLSVHKADICLLSSVLQYIEKPYDLLDELKTLGIKYLLVDRTPFIAGKDRITIQKVHPAIYEAKYPCWFFNREKFIERMTDKYDLILEFDALDKANVKSEFKGFLFEIKS